MGVVRWFLALLLALGVAHGVAAQTYFGNLDAKASLVTLTAEGALTRNSDDQANYSGKGVVLGINISAKTGTIAVTVKIQGKDYVSGQYYDICTSASLTSAAFSTLTTYPGAAATSNVVCSAVLPATWRVQVVSGTGSSPVVTMTVGASVVE